MRMHRRMYRVTQRPDDGPAFTISLHTTLIDAIDYRDRLNAEQTGGGYTYAVDPDPITVDATDEEG